MPPIYQPSPGNTSPQPSFWALIEVHVHLRFWEMWWGELVWANLLKWFRIYIYYLSFFVNNFVGNWYKNFAEARCTFLEAINKLIQCHRTQSSVSCILGEQRLGILHYIFIGQIPCRKYTKNYSSSKSIQASFFLSISEVDLAWDGMGKRLA